MENEKTTLSWYGRNRGFLWSYVRFLVYFTVLFIFVTSNFGQGEFIQPFTATIAAMTSFALNIFGMGTQAEGTIVAGETFRVQIVNGCNGLYESITIVAAMIAAPRSWMQRTFGIAVALVIIYFLNIIRAASLFAIGSYWKDWFEFSHIYIGQTVVVVSTVAIFLVWGQWTRPESRDSAD